MQAKLAKYLTERKLTTGYESYDTVVHFYYKFPTRILKKGKSLNLKADVAFLFDNEILTQVPLSFFAPCDWVPENLKQTIPHKTLAELEEQLVDKTTESGLDLEKQFENISLIERIYVSRLYNDLATVYRAKYGNPIIIKKEIPSPPFLMPVGKYKNMKLQESQEASF